MIIVLHGGAGHIAESERDAYTRGLVAAREAGYAALLRGADALEAVLAAVTLMEDNPDAFNAGTGGSPNQGGVVECDAAVMAGWDRSAGAVGALTTAKNPILVADRVRRESPHLLLVGAGAAALVEHPVDNATLLTDRTRAAYARWQRAKHGPVGSATVGAVALDRAGRLAAATSTGGMLGKAPGRLGDSPLIGSGTYADANIAVSCTGKGEAFVRAVAAHQLASRLEHGQLLDIATQAVLDDVQALAGEGGLIALSATGQLCIGYNAEHMAYAWQSETGAAAEVGVAPGVYPA